MILTQLCTYLFRIFGLAVLELYVIIGGTASSAGIGALADGFAVEDGLRLIEIDLGNATAASAGSVLLLMQIIINKFY